jgi:predicted NBD/HSP70 family sugar kinase
VELSKEKSSKSPNRSRVLYYIKKYGNLTIEDCINKSGLSRPTILKILQDLKEDKIISCNGFKESTGGRAARLFHIDDKTLLSIGIILFYPTLNLVVGNLRGDTLFSSYTPFRENITYEELMQLLYDKIGEAKNFINGLNAKLLGIGVGLPGRIDIRKGISVNIERITGWNNIPICKLLEERYQVPVLLNNDITLISMVNIEANLLLGKSLLYIRMHKGGLGSAHYYKENLVDGKNGNSSNFGHIVIERGGRPCYCGNKGCLEMTASFCHMLNIYRESLPLSQVNDFAGLVARLRENDPLARDIIFNGGYQIGLAIANIVKMNELDLVVISIPKELKLDEYFRGIRKGYNETILPSVKELTRFKIEYMEEENTAIGAAKHVANELVFKNV